MTPNIGEEGMIGHFSNTVGLDIVYLRQVV
jgi:hypothetical protein